MNKKTTSMAWLRLAEPSFAFWDNELDAEYDALEYLKERGKQGSHEKLLSILAKAPNVEPPDVRDCI